MNNPKTLQFSDPSVVSSLAELSDEDLDRVNFGVIVFDQLGIVQRYNQYECDYTGLQKARVLGCHVFTDIAQCMNNFMVAQKFEDAAAAGLPLDQTIDYLLTWRMRPTPVALRMVRLLKSPLNYLLLKRLA